MRWRGTKLGGEAGFRSLAGEGQIVVTVEAADRASSYQGVVLITGTIMESLEAYFHQSEQLPTRVLLAASSGVVAGMLVNGLRARAVRKSSSMTPRLNRRGKRPTTSNT